MSDCGSGLDLPRTGTPWMTSPGNESTPLEPDPAREGPTDEAYLLGQREDDGRASYFHVRWLGEAD